METFHVPVPAFDAEEHHRVTVDKWLVREGDRVTRNQPLANLRLRDARKQEGSRGAERLVRVLMAAPHVDEGTVSELCFAAKSDNVPAQATLCTVTFCNHHLIVRGICASCMKSVDKRQQLRRVQIQPSAPDLLLSRSKAALLARSTHQRLSESNKLTLVLDLDHTLLHTTSDPLHGAEAEGIPDCHYFSLQGHPHNWCKLRPGVHEFLQRMNKLFELHVFTHGGREYALQIVNILDPTGDFFSPQQGVGEIRVTSIQDTYTEEEKKRHKRQTEKKQHVRHFKKLERLFPLDKSKVLALDDNKVWFDDPGVVRVIPYHFWRPISELKKEQQQQLLQPAVKRPKRCVYLEEGLEDAHLAEIEQMLTRIHTLHYTPGSEQLHVAQLFHQVRHEVLRGLRLCFSSVFPVGQDARTHDMYQMAVEFGAEVVDRAEDATHLVAAVARTNKVLEAQRLENPPVTVCVTWLIDCFCHFRRMPEEAYLELPAERASLRTKFISELAGNYIKGMQSIQKQQQTESKLDSEDNGEEEGGDDDDNEGEDEDDFNEEDLLMMLSSE